MHIGGQEKKKVRAMLTTRKTIVLETDIRERKILCAPEQKIFVTGKLHTCTENIHSQMSLTKSEFPAQLVVTGVLLNKTETQRLKEVAVFKFPNLNKRSQSIQRDRNTCPFKGTKYIPRNWF